MIYRIVLCSVCIALILPFADGVLPRVAAQTEAEIQRLQQQIDDRNSRLGEIEQEIAEYEAALQEVGSERQSLEQAIRQLELERGRVEADIRRTQNQIDTADLTIDKLTREIRETEESISHLHNGLSENIRAAHQSTDDSFVIILLRNDSLSEFWNELESKQAIRNTMTGRLEELQQLRTELNESQEMTESQREQLVSLRNRYDNQTTLLANNRAEQAELLQATQNEEASYQQLLEERRRAREQIVQEMRDFESELQFILDPTTIPSPGTRVFDWPLDNIRITQLFGGSEFASRNPSVYGGRAYHPGVDFGAPRGTPIYAPLAGVVRAVGNTDLVPGCYSWGKWTLLEHANGLSTLYAHQDVISVSQGQRVSTGEVIGYTGNTGFSTGPHLHFTVYVSEAVSVRQFNEIRTTTSCGSATTPVAATEAYLDPMQYLPPR